MAYCIPTMCGVLAGIVGVAIVEAVRNYRRGP